MILQTQILEKYKVSNKSSLYITKNKYYHVWNNFNIIKKEKLNKKLCNLAFNEIKKRGPDKTVKNNIF